LTRDQSVFRPSTIVPVRWSMVRDGLSQTLAAGEASYPSPTGRSVAIWFGAHNELALVAFRTTQPINCVPHFGGRF
jgi:hypothetical protein